MAARGRAFDLGVFQEGRIEFVEDFATFDHNGDGRVDDGDLLFAVTLRSGKPDQALVLPDADNDYVAFFVQDDWRAAARPDVEPRSALRGRHGRQEHQPRRRDQSDRAAVPPGHAQARSATTSAPASASTGRRETAAPASTAATASTTTAITLQIQSLERGLDGRALPIEVRAGNVFFLDREHGTVSAVRPVDRESVHRLHPAGRRSVGHQHHRQHDAEPERAAVEPRDPAGAARQRRAARRRRAQSRHTLHHRPDHR